MIIAPSILNAPFNHLEQTLKSLEDTSLLHLDIMDGHFVPNLSFGFHVCQQIRKMTTLPLDIHFMTTHTLAWIEQFKELEPSYMTIHIESRDVSKALETIGGHGIKRGLAMKPNTPVEMILPYLKDVDLVLVMTVEPGFGGQTFIYDMIEKIKVLKTLQKTYTFKIQVDGGMHDETLSLVKTHGVDIAVVGSHLFKQDSIKDWLAKR
jgi:ribulose-phosphate 3-epimerase